MCKCSVSVEINQHLSFYRTIEEELDVRKLSGCLEINKEVESIIIKTGVMIDVQAYPDTPVGFYSVTHYNLDEALSIMIDLIEKERKVK